MRAGEFVLVQLSRSAKRRSLARIVSFSGLMVRIECYRTNPERLVESEVSLAQVCACAPESERLTAFRSLYEIGQARARRESAHLTREAFSRMVGVSPRTIAAAESGKRKTQARIRVWILEALRRVEARAAQV